MQVVVVASDAPRAAECADRHDGDGEKVVEDECAPYNINNSKYLSAFP